MHSLETIHGFLQACKIAEVMDYFLQFAVQVSSINPVVEES
jgi:hypothetical protein